MSAELFNHAQELLLKREVCGAIAFFYSAQQAGYNVPECAAGRWQCWMLLGKFEKAWQESDLIASTGTSDQDQLWKGEPWQGRRVMLRCLHGLGDTIQFIRYAPLLKETCSYLAVQTHPELVSLIQGVPGVDRVFTWDGGVSADPVEWDLQLEVTELPRAFRTKLNEIPTRIPYIQIPKQRVQWASAFINGKKQFRVGIIWRAGPFDVSRSIPPSYLSELLRQKDCQFYSLQKNAEPEIFQRHSSLTDFAAHSNSVQDTAALMLTLDLVITADTMTAHLAGALGRPVWIMLPAKADWRWMLARSDTPWYPSARLFRQEVQGEWDGPAARISCALRELLKIRQPAVSGNS